jgi:hypothetical protein
MCLGNKHVDNLSRSAGKLLLCLVPEGADLLEVIMHMIVWVMRWLECGTLIKFVAADHMFWCYGSVFSFLGDHPLQALVAGTVPVLHCLFNKCSSLSLLCGEKGVAGMCADRGPPGAGLGQGSEPILGAAVDAQPPVQLLQDVLPPLPQPHPCQGMAFSTLLLNLVSLFSQCCPYG